MDKDTVIYLDEFSGSDSEEGIRERLRDEHNVEVVEKPKAPSLASAVLMSQGMHMYRSAAEDMLPNPFRIRKSTKASDPAPMMCGMERSEPNLKDPRYAPKPPKNKKRKKRKKRK